MHAPISHLISSSASKSECRSLQECAAVIPSLDETTKENALCAPIVFGSAFLPPFPSSLFLIPRSRKRRSVLTRRLRSCGSFLPSSAQRSIARLEPSRNRGGHWRHCSGRSKVQTGIQKRQPRHKPAPASQEPVSRTNAEPTPDLPTEVVTAGDFPGSIRIPGTESAIKLGGQARMVAVHTLDALGTEDRFITSSIPVGVPRAGQDARTVYSPTASRLSTELRMPSQRGPMRLFIESDFAGAGRTMRLRHAFLQTNRFVVGQTWSTFSDPEADPIGIDFEGLNAISRFRQPVFRWTPALSPNYQLALALENPAPDLTGAQGVNFSPDIVARLRFQPGRKRGLALYTDHIQASLVVRQLRGEVSGQPEVKLATAGIGANVSGVLVTRWDAEDRIKFAVNAGSGIGRYIADLSSEGGQDAVYDPVQVSLRALPVSSGYFGYEHAWSRVFTTVVTYGVVNVATSMFSRAMHSTGPSGHRSI